jgi:hypothetical protein
MIQFLPLTCTVQLHANLYMCTAWSNNVQVQKAWASYSPSFCG